MAETRFPDVVGTQEIGPEQLVKGALVRDRGEMHRDIRALHQGQNLVQNGTIGLHEGLIGQQ